MKPATLTPEPEHSAPAWAALFENNSDIPEMIAHITLVNQLDYKYNHQLFSVFYFYSFIYL